MNYVLVAKVSWRKDGDDTDTVLQMELGDMKIASPLDIKTACKYIASALNLKNGVFYDRQCDYFPTTSEFYLTENNDPEPGFMDSYKSESMNCYKVELIDSLKINDRLFKLTPLDLDN